MNYVEEYHFPFQELIETGRQTIETKKINIGNIDTYFDHCINILKDSIEDPKTQAMMLHIIFVDKVEIDLSIFDFLFNLMFWRLRVSIGKSIHSVHLFFPNDITKGYCEDYINNVFIDKNRKDYDILALNNIIDGTIGKFRAFRQFQPFLSNSLNLEDTIDLMNQYKEFYDTMHLDVSEVPLEDVKEYGMKKTREHIEFIKNSDHCMTDSFRTGEAVSPKQYKEVAINIGSKPDGKGSVYPVAVNKNFLNGGLKSPTELFIESSNGRVAQILQKTNVGESGEFARKLELNNQDTRLHIDPNYVCGTRNFQKIHIDSDIKLKMLDLRYYRESPVGLDKLLSYKKDKNLIGKTLYFRSPMTCSSAARGEGICYKCYGDLAYTNREVNVGQIASEGLSSRYTQTLLSAKHLLESSIIKLVWPDIFLNLFSVELNTIVVRPDVNLKGYMMIIDEGISQEDENDDIDNNYYITKFTVIDPSGTKFEIHSGDSDNLYFSEQFLDFVSRSYNDDDIAEIPMHSLSQFNYLFKMEIKNNELSKTMDRVKKLIDVKGVMQQYDRNQILEEFINTNIQGGIKLNTVHFEMLLMNQIRKEDDDLEKPNWDVPNQTYQLVTLNNSLSNNPSIAVRLQSTAPAKVLLNPSSRKTYKASIDDLYFMEQPQEFLDNDNIISDENLPESDRERNIIEPFTFDNPKIKVGRSNKKHINKKDAINNPNNY